VLLRRLKQKESLVAEVNDKGEVTVEDQVLGRLEGFRFRQDSTASPQEEKTLRAAAVAALAPEFHLRADRFYNAPDTELDFTEQGGLMWGAHAVGKLAKGDGALKPRIEVFVDEEAGAEVIEKVTRRLQHFIDRKIAALFEPLLGIEKDEALTGLARGFGFQLVEAMGIIPREKVAQEVKALDQDARGLLRKHGVRFGQFTIFMPALLKPAPTRLRLVLWSLANGKEEFPEAPPPGLVTIPVVPGIEEEVYTLSGYRPAGARAIRIDMLERLADQLRAQDSRGGFEANPDMLSITGMTLEQFAALMQGLGYKAELGHRAKQREVDHEHGVGKTSEVEAAPWTEKPGEAHPGESGASEAAAVPEADGAGHSKHLHIDHLADSTGYSSVEAQPDVDDDDESAPHPGEPGASEAETNVQPGGEPEVFFTFTWGGFGQKRSGGGRDRARSGKPQGQGGKPGSGRKRPPKGGAKGGAKGGSKPQSYQARPPKREKPIDPDNPFAAALMRLKDKK
ncbi:MAG TPA: disulfide oxidoreductase, partial [Rhodobacterales bacterium]|nr:disulfide oxidoreductase [Rhodobacterales bacterium]